jgi:hypothetical protein
MRKKWAWLINISLSVRDDMLCCTICDNGLADPGYKEETVQEKNHWE